MVASQPRGVHLVGSVPLANSEAVFRTASSILGERLQRIPDGETGVRTNWIMWQRAVFAALPEFEELPPAPDSYASFPAYRLRDGVTASDLTLGPLGYAAAARASFAIFSRLQETGQIPAGARFQVSLPTPLAPVRAYVAPENHAAVDPIYEAKLHAELDEILAEIPHEKLAIQWDVAVEMGMLEMVPPAQFDVVERDIIDRIVRISGWVSNDVELGYHLCYGDYEHHHFVQPVDTAKLVHLANAIAAGVSRPIQWVHMPVPRDRSDDAYFAPLRELKLHPETKLYLGLVHYTDGVQGAQRRIAAAQRAVAEFGVATECGLGRRPAATIPDLLRIHAEVSGQ